MEHARLECSCPPAAKIESIRINIQRKRCSSQELDEDEIHENESGFIKERKPESEGKPLDTDTRALMESRFGHDFSKVRVHADERSSQLADKMGACAFTIQQDIYFGQGQYRPDLPNGQMLLAHELVHTIQQEKSSASQSNRILGSNDPLEAEAHTIASVFAMGVPIVQGMITSAGPALIAAIGRQAMARQLTIQRSPDQDPEIIRFIAQGILRSLQVDPDDRSGIVKRQLGQMSSSARASVLLIVQAQVSSEEWESLSRILAEPLAGTEVQAPEEPLEEPISEVEAEAEVSEETETEADDGADQEIDLEVGSEEQREGTIEPGMEAELPESGEEEAEVEAPEKPGVSGAEATLQSAAAPEAAEEMEKPAAPASTAAAVPAVPGAEVPEAVLAPEEEISTQVESRARPRTEAAEAEEEAEEPLESGAEPEEPLLESAEDQAEIQIPNETSRVEETPESAPGEPSDYSPLPMGGTSAPSEDGIDQESAPAAEPIPAEEQPIETTESAPEIGAEETHEPETAGLAESAPEPEGGIAEEPGQASAPSLTEAEMQPSSGAERAAEIESIEETAPPTSPESIAETPEPSEAEAQEGGPQVQEESTSSSSESVEGECTPSPEGAPPAEAAEGVSGACGGGGGGAAEERTEQPAPEISSSEPVQAMQEAGNLPPSQLQRALGDVSRAASQSVSTRREELASNPPQMERPSGVPASVDASSPREAIPEQPQRELESVERVPEGTPAPAPQPEPLPAAPAAPTDAVAAPRLQGGEQLTEADTARMQRALSSLPTTDPALNLRAGSPPRLDLTGDADPQQAREQRARLEESTAGAEAEGARDASQPLGEDEIYPLVPAETLTASIDQGSFASSPGAGLQAPAAGAASASGPSSQAGTGGGSPSDDAVSIVAQEEKGDEIRSSVATARSEMVARQEEQSARASEERASSQQEIDQLVETNAAEQAEERGRAREESQRLRREWREGQSALTSDARREAGSTLDTASQRISSEETRANREAAGHIQEGNRRAGDEQRQAEERAARERRNAQQESGGVLSWISRGFTAFFEGIKSAIRGIFEFYRNALRAIIETATRLATEAIDLARRAAVGLIRAAGDALIAIGDRVLAGFPELRDRFRRGIQEGVAQAEAAVNRLAERLKEGVQAALNLLASALNSLLNLLERGYMAAISLAERAVQGAISFARSVVQAFAEFAVLIRDIASNPGQWLRNLGRAVVDGIRNCLWGAFKRNVRSWFSSKLEEVLGLGMAIWNMIRSGCLSLSMVGTMAWEGLKAAIPMVLIQLLIEKLVSMIVPAAGAIMAIIEGLRAAWGTVQRIITAFQRFFTFLRAVKTGNAAGPFAEALAAAAIVVIDFVANWLLQRLRRPAGVVSGRIRAIAQRIGRGMRRGVAAARRGLAAVGRGARRAGSAMRRGFRALGRRAAAAGRAVGRRLAAAGRAVARTRAGRLLARGVRRTRQAARRARERLRAWRERRRAARDRRRRDRQERAYSQASRILQSRLRRPIHRLALRTIIRGLRFRFRFRYLNIIEGTGRFEIQGGFSPGRKIVEGERREITAPSSRSNSPLEWNDKDEVRVVAGSGGIRGGLDFRNPQREDDTIYVIRFSHRDEQYEVRFRQHEWHGHHSWPKNLGGAEDQPLMGMKHAVHLSYVHPRMLAFLAQYGITAHTTRNEAFIRRLYESRNFRRRFMRDLMNFYRTLPADRMPREAYYYGIRVSYERFERINS